jgi:hypothetical protein
VVNVSHAQRPAFEAALSEDNLRPMQMYNPLQTDATALPAADWYATNVYTTTGAEAYSGFDAIRPGWTWSAYAPVRDLQMRIGRAGRVLASPPLALPNSFTNTIFFVMQAPVYVDAERFQQWVPGAASATSPVPLIYCHNDTICPPVVDRSNPVGDPRVSFVAQMTPMDVPLYGLLPTQQRAAGTSADVLPLCFPAPLWVANATYDRVAGDLLDGHVASEWPAGSSHAATGANGTCPSVTNQMLDAQGPFVLGSRRLLHVGAISGSFYVDRVAQATLSRFRARDFIVGAEDVTGKPGFEFALRIYAPDAWVTGTPAWSWEAQIIHGNGSVPVQPATSADPLTHVLQTVAGPATLTQSAFSPAVFRYDGQPFGAGTYMYGMDARQAITTSETTAEAAEAGLCSNYTFPVSEQSVTVCPPNLQPSAFAVLTSQAAFAHSYIAVIGDRVWRIYISSPPGYNIDHTQSTFALAGGLLTALLLTALAVGAVYSRDARLSSLEKEAATRAHALVTSYAAHELRQPGE